jgi:hypothetical protein
MLKVASSWEAVQVAAQPTATPGPLLRSIVAFGRAIDDYAK